ncbi:MAG: CHAD domain-containing protein [Candidatus Sulfotelmatobacter sp.]
MSKGPIQSVFQKLERDLVKVCSKQNAESVHSFRSAARRLQTLLEELAPEQERHHRKLLKALGRIRRRAGKLRDLDVQLAALRSLKVPQEPRRKSQLTNSLIELRTEHEKKLRKALNKEVVRDIRRRLKRAAKDVKSAALGDPLAIARKMLGHPPHPDARGTLTEDLLHHYRIIGKRARYVAELAPPSAEATEFITQLKHMQDAAGDWHDWFTLTRTAAKRLGDVHESSLVAALHNVTGAKFRNAVTALSALGAVQTAHKAAVKPATLMRPAAPRASRKTGQPATGTAA